MQSAAFVVGPEDGDGAALMQLSADVGFEAVAYYTGSRAVLAQMRRTPVCFFLVSSSVPKSQISEFVTEIRLHMDAKLRYSPLLYLSEDPSPRTISFCMQSGFDDIVAPPFTAPRLMDRLKGQLGKTKIYCRTDTYFGPDRRRLEKPDEKVSERRGTGGICEIMEVRRDLRAGINVLKHRPSPNLIRPATPASNPVAAAPLAPNENDMLLLD